MMPRGTITVCAKFAAAPLWPHIAVLSLLVSDLDGFSLSTTALGFDFPALLKMLIMIRHLHNCS